MASCAQRSADGGVLTGRRRLRTLATVRPRRDGPLAYRGLVLFGMAVLLPAIVLLGSMAPPLRVSCAQALARDVCVETVEAALQRGLPAVHPLILRAHVEPGLHSTPRRHGHRATVSFHMLAVPGPADVRLFYDMGGHWGGVSDGAALEVAMWSAFPALPAFAVLALLASVGTPRRRQVPRRPRA